MAVAHTDITAYMGIPDFDANSQPTSTDVGTLITEAQAFVDDLEITPSTTQKDVLTKLRVCAVVARMPGLFDDGISLADSYLMEYRMLLKDVRLKKQWTLPNSDHAYSKIKKVNG